MPDLVTMDITMPEMDGITALKAIRQMDPKASHHVQCHGPADHGHGCNQAGAMDFIVKPFDNDRVIESLNKAIR